MHEWRYDPGAHMPPPTGVLEVKLNKSMGFEFLDRGDMRIKFSQEGISHELDAGVRPRREGTYLDNRFVTFGEGLVAAYRRDLEKLVDPTLQLSPPWGIRRRYRQVRGERGTCSIIRNRPNPDKGYAGHSGPMVAY